MRSDRQTEINNKLRPRALTVPAPAHAPVKDSAHTGQLRDLETASTDVAAPICASNYNKLKTDLLAATALLGFSRHS